MLTGTAAFEHESETFAVHICDHMQPEVLLEPVVLTVGVNVPWQGSLAVNVGGVTVGLQPR